MSGQPTPRPWQIFNVSTQPPDTLRTGIKAKDGTLVARVAPRRLAGYIYEPDPEAEANARFIVQACNSHDELLEVARAIRDCRPEYETAEENQRLTQRLADAIAKAERRE